MKEPSENIYKTQFGIVHVDARGMFMKGQRKTTTPSQDNPMCKHKTKMKF
jgi:hypothetical protein